MYNTSFGHIVTTDGSTIFPIPAVDPTHIEKTAVIPLEFAHSKVKEVATDLRDLRQKYEKHVNQLTSHYTRCAEDTRSYYEKAITELKLKAQRHVEIEKNGRKASEDSLNSEIQTKLTTIEALRDSLASNNLIYQQTTRKLKESHMNAVLEMNSKFNCRIESTQCLLDIIHRIASSADKSQIENLIAEANSTKKMFISKLDESEMRLMNQSIRVVTSDVINSLCSSVEVLAVDNVNSGICDLKTHYEELVEYYKTARNKCQLNVENSTYRSKIYEQLCEKQFIKSVCGNVLGELCDLIESNSCTALNSRIMAYLHNVNLSETLRVESDTKRDDYEKELISEFESRTALLSENYEKELKRLTDEMMSNCSLLNDEIRNETVDSVIQQLLNDVDDIVKEKLILKLSAESAARPVQTIVEQERTWGEEDEDVPEASAITDNQLAETRISIKSVNQLDGTSIVSSRNNDELLRKIADLELQIVGLKSSKAIPAPAVNNSLETVSISAAAPISGNSNSNTLEASLAVAHLWVRTKLVGAGEDCSKILFIQDSSVKLPDVPISEAMLLEMQNALQTELNQLENAASSFKAKETVFDNSFQELSALYELKVTEKTSAKAALKTWMKEFEEANGRQPDNDERATVKHLFVAHKDVCYHNLNC